MFHDNSKFNWGTNVRALNRDVKYCLLVREIRLFCVPMGGNTLAVEKDRSKEDIRYGRREAERDG